MGKFVFIFSGQSQRKNAKHHLIFTLLLASFSSMSFAQSEDESPVLFAETDKNPTQLKAYRSNYFGITVDGSDRDLNGQAKFQISFKYKMNNWTGLNMGYTQKSFWSLQEKSEPFAESNFAPEIFNVYEFDDDESGNGIKSLQVGWLRHESTGEDAAGSRGWNTTYLEPTWIYERFTFAPKIWVPFFGLSKNDIASDNPDIFDYLGYGELVFTYDSKSSDHHSLLLRKGEKADQVSLRYQWNIDWNNIRKIFNLGKSDEWNPDVFIQFWDGNGESLKNYKNNTRRVIIGLSIID